MELAIVLAVVSILAAVVVPDFIEIARNDLAQQAAREIALIQDTARWYYSNSGAWEGDGQFRPGNMRWPGDLSAVPDHEEDGITATENCLTGLGLPASGSLVINCHIAYLPPSALENPWGQPYQITLDREMEGMIIATHVPQSVAGVLRSFVQGGECESGFNGGTPPDHCGPLPGPAGYVTCCSTIPRPGREASFSEMMGQFQPEMVGGYCDDEQQVDAGQECPPGTVARGIECNSKDCGNPDTICCRAAD